MTMWDEAKKAYCCHRHSAFCTPGVNQYAYTSYGSAPSVEYSHSYGDSYGGSFGGSYHSSDHHEHSNILNGGIMTCGSSDHQCPSEWESKALGGYHCMHKLTRQTSEAAYQASGGACRPAHQGPFPSEDCHVQCVVGSSPFGAGHEASAHHTESFGGGSGSYTSHSSHFYGSHSSGTFGSTVSHAAGGKFRGFPGRTHVVNHAFPGRQEPKIGGGVHGIFDCGSHDHRCPEEWFSGKAGGFHCKHKLARQTSEKAYLKSGGACRPAADGPFPHDDCQDQCSIGNVHKVDG
mmetsp:Transcript_6117/g.13962  ORF Transcript_6117/g.13962 Transcript_6117/m.13962 type:complete len:290 (+) Transcript_6117:60-929(+)